MGRGKLRAFSEAFAEGGPAFRSSHSARAVSDALFEAAGKNSADVETAINAKPAPASFDVPGVTVELHTATAEQRRANSYNVVGLIEGSDPL